MAAYTPKQGQFLAYIHNYTLLNGQPPAEHEMERYFHSNPMSVHQMGLALERKHLIQRTPGKARSIRLLVAPEALPGLDQGTATAERPKKLRKACITGRWRITEMELWGEDYLDEEVEAYIRFSPRSTGEFEFGSVYGSMDCRFIERGGKPVVEWSCAGNAGMEQASGRGWAVLEDQNTLKGRIFIHDGDDSGFIAKRTPGQTTEE